MNGLPVFCDNYFTIRTGDHFNLRQERRVLRMYKCRFDDVHYVKKLTLEEAKVALREIYLDDLEEHEYEGPDKECVDDEAEFNLSLSDAEPSVG